MATRIAEILTNGGTRKGCQILQCCSIGRRCHNHNRVVHRAILAQRLDQRRDRRSLLTHSHIDAIDRLALLEVLALIDDRIDRNSRLTRLAVTNDQLTLTTTNRNHRINSLQTRLQRLIHRLAEDHTGSLTLQRHLYPLATNRTSTIERLTQRIDHATEHLLADHNRRRTSRTLDRSALFDAIGRAEQYGTHVILLQVHHHGTIAILKLQQLARFGIA